MFAFLVLSPSAFSSRPTVYSAFNGRAVTRQGRLSGYGKAWTPSRRRATTMLAPELFDTTLLSNTIHDTQTILHHVFSTTSSTISSMPTDSLLHSISSVLADATAAVSQATEGVDVAGVATEAAAAGVKQTGAWENFVHLIESAIVFIHNGLMKAGVPGAYGLSIILFTFIIKAVTFPLNFRQMESTMKMQAIAPKLRKIQADYRDNPTVMQQMTAELYRKQNVNPLAGCAPVFAQIPIWVALYRSVLNLASENKLNEPFLWLPSLQGPVSSTGKGLDTWLYPLVDGAPPIGWHDALCYLILPVILMVNQYLTTKLVTPQTDDGNQQQAAANNFLKFMPLLIGWFSLNVPSGLGVYWVTNNMLSTLQTLYIRSQFPASSFVDDDDDSDGAIDVSASQADGFNSSAPASTAANAKSSKASKNKKRRKRR